MVQLARAQGVPVSIYRPARVTGASDTGASNTADLFPAFIKGCIQLGAVPDTDEEMNMSPVDFVAAAIVRLSLHPGAQNGDYHLFNNRTIRLSRFAAVMNACGFPVRTIPYAGWVDALKGKLARGEENALTPFIAFFSPDDDTNDPVFDTTQTDAALAAVGLICPAADEGLVATYLRSLSAGGYLPVPATIQGDV
jgi:thioester reductase-like protein